MDEDEDEDEDEHKECKYVTYWLLFELCLYQVTQSFRKTFAVSYRECVVFG